MPVLCRRAGVVPDRAEFAQGRYSNHRYRRGAACDGRWSRTTCSGCSIVLRPARTYADLHGEMMRAFAEYKQDVIVSIASRPKAHVLHPRRRVETLLADLEASRLSIRRPRRLTTDGTIARKSRRCPCNRPLCMITSLVGAMASLLRRDSASTFLSYARQLGGCCLCDQCDGITLETAAGEKASALHPLWRRAASLRTGVRATTTPEECMDHSCAGAGQILQTGRAAQQIKSFRADGVASPCKTESAILKRCAPNFVRSRRLALPRRAHSYRSRPRARGRAGAIHIGAHPRIQPLVDSIAADFETHLRRRHPRGENYGQCRHQRAHRIARPERRIAERPCAVLMDGAARSCAVAAAKGIAPCSTR